MAHKKGSALAKAVQKPVPVKIVSEPVKSNSEYDAREKRWRAEDDLRALQRAEEIRGDKSRMSEVKKCATEQMNALKKIK